MIIAGTFGRGPYFEQPDSAINYSYRRSLNPSGYDDIVFNTFEGPSIKIDGVCYCFYLSSKETTPTNPVPTIDESYSSCDSCVLDTSTVYEYQEVETEEDAMTNYEYQEVAQ